MSKRTMLQNFKNSSYNTLFVQTKYYSYKIEKLEKNYRVVATEEGQLISKTTYLDYANLEKAIIGNVKNYEMDYYNLEV